MIVHLIILLGFGVIAVVVPALVLSVRRTPATYALVTLVWLFCAAGILATRDQLEEHTSIGLVDMLRLAAVAVFVIYVVLHRREMREAA